MGFLAYESLMVDYGGGNERWMRIEWSVVGLGLFLTFSSEEFLLERTGLLICGAALAPYFSEISQLHAPSTVYFYNFSSVYFLKYLYVKIAYIITRHYSNNHKNYLILPCLVSERPKDYSSPKF